MVCSKHGFEDVEGPNRLGKQGCERTICIKRVGIFAAKLTWKYHSSNISLTY